LPEEGKVRRELRNELSWSFSRKEIFETCRRKYYYHYYLAWGGWDREAAPRRQIAYRLSKMTGIDSYIGMKVHHCVAGVVSALKNGGVLAPDERSITEGMDRDFKESAEKLWQRDPKEHCNFFEDYYGGGLSDERKEAAKAKVISCVNVFLGSPVLNNCVLIGGTCSGSGSTSRERSGRFHWTA
jgi:hypothetical protein